MTEDPSIPPYPESFISYAQFHHRPALRRTSPNTFLSASLIAFWVWMAAVLLGAFALLAWAVASSAFAAASPVLGILMLAAASYLLRGVRRARAVAGLNYLEQAVRLNLPLPPMLLAAERAEQGRLRKKLHRLRAHLEDGQPLADALDDALPGRPPRVISLVAAAEQTGRLPSTLGRLVAELRRPAWRDPSRAILLRWYPPVLVLGITAVLGVFSLFVAPKITEIFRDFGIEVPRLTLATLRVWTWLGGPLGVLVALIALAGSGRMLGDAVAPGWARGNLGPLADVPGWVAWWLPVAGSVQRSRGLADVCHVLADSVASGRPIHSALRDASGLGVNPVLRHRLARWADGVESGTPLADAAREARMPRTVYGLLATTSARGAADAAEVFEFLARYYEGRFSRAAALLEAAVVPAMVLFFAFFVASATVGMFLPMVELMDRVGGLTGFN